MMLAPLTRPSRRMTSVVESIPPPWGGWNARDDLANMKIHDAIVLDNVLPLDQGVVTRPGYIEWATGLGGPVLSLLEYNSTSGASTLFGATSSAIYDVTAQGAVGAAAVSSLSNGHWQSCMFATAGGNFLVAVNGANGVRTYDGSAWATQTITGVTASTLVHVTSHQQRLWFTQDNTLRVWYLGTSAISGAATAIDLGPHSKLGGYLMAMASWTRDGGAGMEDLAVFVTSRGELHIFAGTDPSSASTWEKIGTFKIPEPIGRRCMVKVGGDIGILTTQGLIPLSGVLQRSESAQGRVAITDKIRKAFSEAYDDAPTARGWCVQEYPVGKVLLINVPLVEGTSSMQFVMNANTGAWCRFTGWDALDMSLSGTDLYWSTPNGTVNKWGGSTDNGANIEGTAVSAFTSFRTPRTKYFKRAKPQFFGPGGYRPAIGLALDYSEDYTNTVTAPAATTGGTAWDLGDWDVMDWAPPNRPSQFWQGLRGSGFAAAFIVGFNTPEQVTYNGSKILFEVGDAL